ncbi:DUF5983 family protein [Microvirga sp. P5_D2]
MALRTFLDLSTAHLTYEDVELIEAEALPMACMTNDYGWIVSTATLIDEQGREERVAKLREIGFSDIFITLAVHAAKMGAWLLRFDCDEAIDPMLPVGGYGMIEYYHEIDLGQFGHGDGTDLESGRYLVCGEVQFPFLHDAQRPRHCAERIFGWNGSKNHLADIRWALDLATMELVLLHIFDDHSMTWSDATPVQHKMVSDRLQQLRSTFPLVSFYSELRQCDALPDWRDQST